MVFYNILDNFLQISGPFSTNVTKIFYKCHFLKTFYKCHENLLQIQLNPSKKRHYFCLFWTVSALITSKTPKKFRALRAQGFYSISTNCSRVFYKLHFSTNCTADLRILLQMSLFSSTNELLSKKKALKCNFSMYFLRMLSNIGSGSGRSVFLQALGDI